MSSVRSGETEDGRWLNSFRWQRDFNGFPFVWMQNENQLCFKPLPELRLFVQLDDQITRQHTVASTSRFSRFLTFARHVQRNRPLFDGTGKIKGNLAYLSSSCYNLIDPESLEAQRIFSQRRNTKRQNYWGWSRKSVYNLITFYTIRWARS